MPIQPRYELTLHINGPESKEHNCVLHYTGAAPADQTAMNNLAVAVSNAWAADIKPVIPTECSYVGATLRYISAAFSFDSFSTAGAGAGTVTGDTAPAEVAAIFSKHGFGPSKRARGTMYMPCVPVAYFNSSVLNTTGQMAYVAISAQIAQTIVSGGITLQPVVMSRKADSLFSITQVILRTILGHQRRRRPEPV